VARVCTDVQKAYLKVDELESQIMTYKTNTMDMQSHMMNSHQDLSDKWRASHMQLSGQVHAATEWCDTLRTELMNKMQTAAEKSSKVEASGQQLAATIASVLSRVEGNENEIKNLDENLLNICSTIHAMQSISKLEQGTPSAETSLSRDQALYPAATCNQGSTDHSAHSTNAAQTNRDRTGDSFSRTARDSGGEGVRGNRQSNSLAMGEMSPDFLFSSSPILSDLGGDAGACLKSTEAVHRIGRQSRGQVQNQKAGCQLQDASMCRPADANGRQPSRTSHNHRPQPVSPIACSLSAQVCRQWLLFLIRRECTRFR